MSENQLRKTKIICTIGPATIDIKKMRELHAAGMNIARLNMSHGDREQHTKIIQNIKTINRTASNPIAILLDTQGPEIRTGDVSQNVLLKVGEEIDITIRDHKVENKSTIFVNYRDLIKDLNPGDRVTVDNGLINLDVIEKSDYGLKCRVVDGGVLKSRRHINLPGVRVNLPSITPKDEKDIIFGLEQDVDFIALSFVRTAADIDECKRLIRRKEGHAQVIAKIEDHFGSQNYQEITASAAGIMVARGDLGVEVPIEDLPIIQRRLLKECAEQGKKCIIATHLLESMIESPFPTRAEVTDVANGVYEEADALMLSGETSIGKYPAKAVGFMSKICKRIERSGGLKWARNRQITGVKVKLAKAATELADDLKADGMVVITRRGIMADHVASFHPKYSPIFAFTNMTTVRRKMILYRGVFPYRIDFSNDPEKTIQNAFNIIRKKEILKPGSTVVVVSDVLAGQNRVDAIQVRRVEKVKPLGVKEDDS